MFPYASIHSFIHSRTMSHMLTQPAHCCKPNRTKPIPHHRHAGTDYTSKCLQIPTFLPTARRSLSRRRPNKNTHAALIISCVSRPYVCQFLSSRASTTLSANRIMALRMEKTRLSMTSLLTLGGVSGLPLWLNRHTQQPTKGIKRDTSNIHLRQMSSPSCSMIWFCRACISGSSITPPPVLRRAPSSDARDGKISADWRLPPGLVLSLLLCLLCLLRFSFSSWRSSAAWESPLTCSMSRATSLDCVWAACGEPGGAVDAEVARGGWILSPAGGLSVPDSWGTSRLGLVAIADFLQRETV
mmetsp:Transcript_16951/g.48325  ORF Transcript_16951/g.48325 Transcript_16951/m.48325 type:complete len:299 (-) Transcript_16951:42-938(-)